MIWKVPLQKSRRDKEVPDQVERMSLFIEFGFLTCSAMGGEERQGIQ
jgi:hypothetical protein